MAIKLALASNADTESVSLYESEGAVKSSQKYYVDDAYAEVEGKAVELGSLSLVLTVYESDDRSFSIGENIEVQTSAAWWKDSVSSCLSSDDSVEMNGYISEGVFHAAVVESDDYCRFQYDFDDDSDDEEDD